MNEYCREWILHYFQNENRVIENNTCHKEAKCGLINNINKVKLSLANLRKLGPPSKLGNLIGR